eukprot:6129473-Prymnesium_polylepis.1
MCVFLRSFGMPGWRPPWSMTRPLTRLESSPVELLSRLADAEHGVNDNVSEEVCELLVHLGAEDALRDLQKELAVERVLLHLRPVDELEHRRLREVDAVAQQPRVDAVRQVALRLLHELADNQHGGRGAVAGDVVLRGGDPRDHHRRRVLDLHLVEQRVAVLGQLDVAGTRHKHLQRALRPKVGLEHVLQAARRVDVHLVRDALLEHLRIA